VPFGRARRAISVYEGKREERWVCNCSPHVIISIPPSFPPSPPHVQLTAQMKDAPQTRHTTSPVPASFRLKEGRRYEG